MEIIEINIIIITTAMIRIEIVLEEDIQKGGGTLRMI
jgi:hypothetical protein